MILVDAPSLNLKRKLTKHNRFWSIGSLGIFLAWGEIYISRKGQGNINWLDEASSCQAEHQLKVSQLISHGWCQVMITNTAPQSHLNKPNLILRIHGNVRRWTRVAAKNVREAKTSSSIWDSEPGNRYFNEWG